MANVRMTNVCMTNVCMANVRMKCVAAERGTHMAHSNDERAKPLIR